MDCKEFKKIVVDLFDKDVDPQIKAECEKHINQCAECKEYYELLLTTTELLRPKHSPVSSANNKRQSSRHWLRVAAMFVGVIILSGIAFATIHLLSQRPTEENVQKVESNLQLSNSHSQLSSPVRFDDVSLDSILTVVSAYYGKTVHFLNNEAKAMKFIMTWKPDAPLGDFIEGLNMFDGLRLSLQQDTIFVETTEGKESTE
jgi:hypothetical protein